MPATTRKRTGGTQATPREGPETPGPRTIPKIAEAVKKKMQAATKVGNLSWSEGIMIKGDEEARIIAMAKAVLVHQGYEEEEDSLKAASEDLGLALWEVGQDKAQGSPLKATWEMVAELCHLGILVISNSKEQRYPPGATMPIDKTMCIAQGTEDCVFVVLHPARRPTGTAEEFVTGLREKWSEELNRKRSIVELVESEDEKDWARAKKGKKREDEGTDFEVSEAHPVLEDFLKFDEFRLSMKRVTARREMVWTPFIGEAIMGRFDLIYRVLVQKDFANHKTSKARFLQNVQEVVNYNNATSARRRGEPRLRDDPELVPKFISEYADYIKQEGKGIPKLEQVEQLLRAIEEKHRAWAEEIEMDVRLFRSDHTADACLVQILMKLEKLGAEETKRRKSQGQGRGGPAGRRGERQGMEATPEPMVQQWQMQHEAGGQGRAGQLGLPHFQGHQGYHMSAGFPFYAGMGMQGEQGGNQGTQLPNQSYHGAHSFQPVLGNVGHQVNQLSNQSYHGAQGFQPALGIAGVAGTQFNQGSPPFAGGGRGEGGRPRNQGIGQQAIVCFNCGVQGHRSTQCTVPRKCRICGSERHLSWACDKKGSEGTTKEEIKGDSTTPSGTLQQYIPQLGARARNVQWGQSKEGEGVPAGQGK